MARVAKETGDVMLWVAAAAPFLLVGMFSLVSAGHRWNDQQEAAGLAAATARAGARPDVETLRLRPGDRTMLAQAEAARRAEDRARRFWEAATDRQGDLDVAATVESDGRMRVTVVVTFTTSAGPVTGQATAVTLAGVGLGAPGSMEMSSARDERTPAR